MGNWRTVRIIGTVSAEDLPALWDWVDIGTNYERLHPLCDTHSILGINNWPALAMDRVGNLAERDFDVLAVAECIGKIVDSCPSLELKIHCGGEFESKECVATINVCNRGVSIDAPELEKVGEMTQAEMESNTVRALSRPRE